MNNVKKTLRTLFNKIGNIFLFLGRSCYMSEQEIRVQPWFKDDGEKKLRLNYDLSNNSLLFDLGGYEGQWTSDIYSMYQPTIYVFEPVEEFSVRIKERFKNNNNIYVYDFGLAGKTEELEVSVEGDSSSTFKKSKKNRKIKLIKASDFIRENNIKTIDLMKVNIEGGEYDLLQHLIDSELIKRIENIQVQFHDFVPDAESRMHDIQKNLAKTHSLTYQYPFVWENWEIKNF